MGGLLAILRIGIPIILRSAESGTLLEIAKTAARLIELLRPLLADAAARQSLDSVAAIVEAATVPRPAQPEDPVFARQGRAKFGGR